VLHASLLTQKIIQLSTQRFFADASRTLFYEQYHLHSDKQLVNLLNQRTRFVNNLPSLQDLKLFCAVARNLSFISTASEWGFSPAFVSKRIALLEQNMQVRLLHRTTRRVSVTEDGETILRWAQQILEDVEEMTLSVATTKTIAKGVLRISTSAGFGRKRLAPVLSELASQYPGLEIQLELLARPVDLIGEGFDLDIRIGGKVEPNLIFRRIARNRRILCASPEYLERYGMPDSLTALEQHRCIIMRERDQSFGVWRLQGPKGQETVKVNGPMASNNGEIVHQWAIDGHGIILRSTWDVDSSLRKGTLVKILPEYYQEADITAVYPGRLKESAKVRVCVEFLELRLGNRKK
jgi:LysR family transcriptional activator of dmlA